MPGLLDRGRGRGVEEEEEEEETSDEGGDKKASLSMFSPWLWLH